MQAKINLKATTFCLMPFPDIDPIIFQIGPFALRWYALAYIAGLMIGYRYMVRLASRAALWPQSPPVTENHIDDLLLWVTAGVIIGGRLGYVAFYNAPYYLDHPGQILVIWAGGMSFHGGALGVIAALLLFAKRKNIPALALGDMTAAAVPIGIFFGRIANFINSELWGRPTDVAWGVVFPNGGPVPRHPSQLYEAGLEGLLIFAVITYFVWRRQAFGKPGLATGLFVLIYGLSRMFVEFFRQPDAHIGFLSGGITMGQVLCVPMIIAGLAFITFALRKT